MDLQASKPIEEDRDRTEICVLYSLCLRGAEGERRRLDEADVVARTFVDAVEVCESSWREFEVCVEVLEQDVDGCAAVFYVAGEKILVGEDHCVAVEALAVA